MAYSYSTQYLKSEPLSTEKQKESKKYLEDQGNYHISTLVKDISQIQTSRNYYSAKRNAADFQFLEDVYGMQNPIDIGFTNIIKPRVDALIGLSLLSAPEFTVAYVDKDTIATAEKERVDKFIEELKGHTNQYIAKSRDNAKADPKAEQGGGGKVEGETETFLNALGRKYGEDFQSSYQVAAADVLDILLNDADIDIETVKKEISKDYFITGQAYTRDDYKGEGRKPGIERIMPEELFSNRPRIDTTFKNTDAVVRRQFMRPHQILRKFGDKITPKMAVEIFGRSYSAVGGSVEMKYGAPDVNVDMDSYDDSMDSLSASTGYSNDGVTEGVLYQVYHVEWLASTKIPNGKGGYVYREDRYEIYRIGSDQFLGGRRCKEAPRRKDEPWKTSLSYKGLVNHPGNGHIVSMVLQMKELQDLYDIIMFFRNNFIATSGVSGSRVNVAAIPKSLGKNLMSRLTKWLTIRKQGVELVDPTEEGAELFQHYGDFSSAIKGDSINGINSVLEGLLAQADITSGVPRQMLGIIEERDAVENVKVGMNQVSILSLEMFRDIDVMMSHAVLGMLDGFKYAYKDKTFEGVKTVGIAAIPITVDPSKFSVADHDVRVVSAGIENAKLTKIVQLAKELLGGGQVDADVIVSLLNARTVQKAEYMLRKGIDKKKEEMANLQQMQQQLEEASNQIKKLTAEIERMENNKQALEKEKLAVTKARDAGLQDSERKRLTLEERRINNEAKYKDKELALKAKTVELEKEQIMYGSGSNIEVNNTK